MDELTGVRTAVLLGVQVLSEASYANRAYQPISVNWATQQVVKQWYQQLDHRAAVTTLSSLFKDCRLN